jgi:hypothetical protein
VLPTSFLRIPKTHNRTSLQVWHANILYFCSFCKPTFSGATREWDALYFRCNNNGEIEVLRQLFCLSDRGWIKYWSTTTCDFKATVYKLRGSDLQSGITAARTETNACALAHTHQKPHAIRTYKVMLWCKPQYKASTERTTQRNWGSIQLFAYYFLTSKQFNFRYVTFA